MGANTLSRMHFYYQQVTPETPETPMSEAPVYLETAQSWNGSPKKGKPKKGLKERLSREKRCPTEAELMEQQNSAYSRRYDIICKKVDKAALETQKCEQVLIKNVEAEAALQVASATKWSKCEEACAYYQTSFEERVNNAQRWRTVVKENASTDQAKADRAKAQAEAAIIPVHTLSR